MSAIEELLETVERTYGLQRRHDWQRIVKDVLSEAAQNGAPHDREERSKLIEQLTSHLTIGETYFYRIAEHFEVLAGHVARWCETEGADPVLWSAGCATGEEPYSMAIAIRERCGDAVLSRVRILGTDINPQAIAKAREASYSAWSFRELPAALLSRYFAQIPGAGWRLSPSIGKRVEFDVAETLATAQSLPSASIDAVFFRNVAIYLSDSATAAIHHEIRRVLKPNGLFFVAPGDPRPRPELLRSIGHSTTSVYRVGGIAPLPQRSPSEPLSEQPTLVENRVTHKRRRIRPTERCTTIPAPAPPPPVHGRRPSLSPMAYADRGDLPTALEAATRLIEAEPETAGGYLVRGQLRFAAGEVPLALNDLRRAVYLAPNHCVARYWYGIALRSEGWTDLALVQFSALRALLRSEYLDKRVEDGETTVSELLDAVRLMQEDIS